MGHLPVYFNKILIPRDWPRGRGGGEWALLELTDALVIGENCFKYTCIASMILLPVITCQINFTNNAEKNHQQSPSVPSCASEMKKMTYIVSDQFILLC